MQVQGTATQFHHTNSTKFFSNSLSFLKKININFHTLFGYSNFPLAGFLQLLYLQLPQHLDGVDDADVGVVEVVQSAEGEGRHDPDESLTQVGN